MRKERRFVKITVSVKERDASEWDETQEAICYVDANSIESFYQDGDGTYITTEHDEFKVTETIEEVLRIVNG